MLGKTKTRGQTKGRGRTQRHQDGKPGYRIDGSKIPPPPKRSVTGAIIQSPAPQKSYPVSPMQQMQPTQPMQLGQQPYSSRGKTRGKTQRRGRTQRRGQQRD